MEMCSWTARDANVSDGCLGHVVCGGAKCARYVVRNESLLDEAQHVVECALEDRNVIVWSGGMGEGLFEKDPRTWMPEARGRFVEACAHVADALRGTPSRVLVRTHCRHVLSDLPACRWFLEELGMEQLGLCVDVAAMFELSMLARVNDHLERLLSQIEGAGLVLIREPMTPGADVEGGVDVAGDLPVAGAVGSTGLVDSRAMGELIAGCVRGGIACAVDTDLGDMTEQLRAMGLSEAVLP